MTLEKFREKYPQYHSPYLIQRLLPPSQHEIKGIRVDQVFAFGGGGSGLSEKAWELLKPCFEFDYMGAAEFEFGALPKSLDPFSKSELMKFQIDFKAKDIKPSSDRLWSKDKDKLPKQPDGTVYVLCRKKDQEFVTDAIKGFAKETFYTKEGVRLNNALDPIDGRASRRACGWYELDTGFFFFTDQSMWERTCQLFLH